MQTPNKVDIGAAGDKISMLDGFISRFEGHIEDAQKIMNVLNTITTDTPIDPQLGKPMSDARKLEIYTDCMAAAEKLKHDVNTETPFI